MAARDSEGRYKLYSWYLEPWLMLLSPALPPPSQHKRCLQGSDSLESGPRLGRLWPKMRVLTRVGYGPQQARGSLPWQGREEGIPSSVFCQARAKASRMSLVTCLWSGFAVCQQQCTDVNSAPSPLLPVGAVSDTSQEFVKPCALGC